MLLCTVMCFMSGGRGGVVLLGIELVMFFYMLNYTGVLSKTKIFFGIFIACIGFIYIADYINLWDSDGFNRVSANIGTDDVRKELQNRSWSIFTDSMYMGKGVGSIWMNLGIYSHNIILDLLAEVGIVGCFIVCNMIFKIFKRLMILSKYNRGCFLILLMFLKGFILTLFSGYWLNCYQIWLGVGFVFALNYRLTISNISKKYGKTKTLCNI